MAEAILTKKAIAKSVKELTKEKPFDKISVGDIAGNCGINRQTFYYHFQDKYELLSWIYYTDLFYPNMENLSFDNWDEKLKAVLEAMKQDQQFYINTIKHTQNYIQEYLVKNAENLFKDAISILDEHNIVSTDERNICSRFFAYGLCGTIMEWTESGMKDSPEYLSKCMRRLLDNCEKAAYNHIIEIKK